ncbi:MAG: hypothetical protein V2A61_04075, partial [Calditrichota bacterium]
TQELATLFRTITWDGFLRDQPERRSLALARKLEHSRHLVEIRFDRSLTPLLPGAISPGQRIYDRLLSLTLGAPYRPAEKWDEL